MAFYIDAHCNSCEYSEFSIRVGDGKHVVFFCDYCTRLVNPERVKYRLDCPNCPSCGRTLQRDHYVDAGKLPATWGNRPPITSELTCPKCIKGKLSFALKMHMRIVRDSRPPEAGQRVHVRVDKRGRWRAADICQTITFEAMEPEVKEAFLVLECEVVSANNRSVVLKRIDERPISELKGYSGYREVEQ